MAKDLAWLKPTKKSFPFFIFLAVLYSLVLLFMSGFNNLMGVRCTTKPYHDVPNIYPGSLSGQVCATDFELVLGYIAMIILYFVIPYAIMYVIAHLRNRKRDSEG